MEGLPPEAARYVLVGQAVGVRPLVLGKVVGAEDPVDPRKVDGEVLVDGLFLRRVVPVMEPRQDQERLQPLDGRAAIAVRPRGAEGNEKQSGAVLLMRGALPHP